MILTVCFKSYKLFLTKQWLFIDCLECLAMSWLEGEWSTGWLNSVCGAAQRCSHTTTRGATQHRYVHTSAVQLFS